MKETDKYNTSGLLVNKNLIEYLPVKCKMYLNLLISVKDDSFNSIPKIIRKNYEHFSSVFQNLDDAERSYFINKNIEFVRQRLNQNTPLIFTPPSICEIQTTCQVKTTFMKMTVWEKRTIKYEYNFQRVKFWTSKKMEVIELKYYLIRRSRSQKNGLVIESFDPIINEKYQKIAFKFNNAAVCGQIFDKIRDSIIELSFKRIECLLYDDLKDQKDLKMAQQKQAMDFTILTTKNINEFFEEKENFMDKLRRGKRQTYEIYSKSKITVQNSLASSKLYYLEYNLPQSWITLAKIRQNIKILGCISVSNQYTCEILEKFNTNISANYYRIRSQNEEFELIMIVQKSEKDGQLQQIMKSTKSIYFGVNVPFMDVSIKKGKDKHYVMTLSAIIKKNPHKKMSQNQQIIIKFLTGLVKTSFQQAQISNKDARMTFLSPEKPSYQADNRNASFGRSHSLRKEIRHVTYNSKNESPEGQIRLKVPFEQRSSQEDSPKEEIFYSIEDILDQQIQDNQKIKDIFYTISSKMIDQMQLNRFTENYGFQKQQPAIKYLYAKCINSPSQKPPIKYITEHNLKVDWQKSAKGGVICINKEAIEEQKRFVKLIFNQLGSKIFQMKGFANFSLPIQICRPQSALVSIGRNISYAPMLLENSQAMKPLERMKKMIILHISWCALALSTQKPFNPILGETYQGFINGCPIFLQQVCHHPAISYLYFLGRGYKIYGQVEPKAQIRLNYINAPSQQMLHIDFDNGDKCQISVPMLVINGLLIGQRSIYYDGVGHVIDVKNHLIAEVRFNAKNNSIFKSKENPDFFMGEIYQVTQSFMTKFLACNRKYSFKKDDKNRQLESISGQWNGVLMFNGQKSFDFQQQLPALLQNSECPLASDSVYREDVVCRSAGDLVKGQQQKERLEEAQRRDKKMRNEHKQSKK